MTKKQSIPRFIEEIQHKFTAGIANAFLVHFNIADYVDHANTLPDYLAKWFKGYLVIFYDRNKGITFPLPSMKKKFVELVMKQELEGDPLAQAAIGESQQKPEDVELPRDPQDALRLIDMALKSGQKVLTIIGYAETLTPNADMASLSSEDRNNLVALCSWGRDLMDTESIAILVTGSLTDVHQALRAASSKIEAVEFPLPDFSERGSFIEALIKARGVKLNLSPTEFAAKTAGLSKVHIEDIVLRAEEMKAPVCSDLITERKADIIKSEYADVCEIVDPTYGFEAVGGLEHVKELFLDIMEFLEKGLIDLTPKGVLLVGPPGTGKTLIAQALAKVLGFNFLSFTLSKILGKYVGESERNMARFFLLARTLAPLIIFVDEFDQLGLSREASGDSGVSSRIFQQLLTFMSESELRGKVIMVFATNRPDLLDAAIVRPGRIDKVLMVGVPDEAERVEIFRVQLEAKRAKVAPDLDLKKIARATEGYTGAEIERLVTKAMETATKEGSEEVTKKHVTHAIWAINPSTKNIEEMTLAALKMCSDKDLVPEKYREYFDKAAKKEEPIVTAKRRRGVK